ncbi:Ig-like domain-containing protein [Paenibacillus sp. 1011MAR3C5]|uniref:Ig-like domain-containing protein n=1 Tax=Paenibacillus sp. 1011MAR3C5 TaxID=1675787 RepID=UPI0015FEEE17|nr:Ig-like domain-containing protein [Paenibacillus sp. 1011MAR3C5]
MSKKLRQSFAFILIIALVSSVMPGGKAYALEKSEEPGLLAWYKLDTPYELNGKSVAEDSSSNGHHAISAIGTWDEDGGVYGGALSFNGVTDLIQLNLGSAPAGSYLKDAFTEHSASLWFKANDTQKLQVLYERGGNASGMAIQLNANKLEAAVVSGERATLSVDFTDTASWHHVMVTFDNGAFTLYLDGEVAAATTASFTKVNSALNEAAIGAKIAVYAFGGDNQTGAWFNGMIDNVRLYDRAVEPSIEVAGVSLNKAQLTATVGESVYLAASLEPSFATNSNVTWTSSDESVVTITGYDSAQAAIEGKKAGSATVTVTTEDGNYTASSEVTILPEQISMPLDDLAPLEAWYKLDGPLSQKGKIVAEDSSGKGHHSFSAIGDWLPGGGVDGGAFSFNGSTSIIQLNTANDTFLRNEFSEFTAAMWFKPADLNTRQVLFERGGNGAGLAVQINEGKLEAAVVNNKPEVNRVILSTELTGTAEWHHVAVSFGNSTFKLFLDGQLAKETGTPFDKVSAAANEGALGARFAVDAFEGAATGGYFKGVIDDVRLYKAAVEPIVGAVSAQSVVLDRDAVTLGKGLTQELVATVLPKHATNQNVIWTSSDDSIAKVSPSGGLKAVVQGVSEGTATITVTAVDGEFTSSSIVTVEQVPVEGISLTPADVEMVVGTTQTLIPTITPENASNRNVSWESTSPSIATVNESGTVTALQPGTASITVTTEDGGYSASMVVTIKGIPVEKISLNHTKVTLAVDRTHLLSPAISPKNATNQHIIWTSSDSSVATVDASGRVTAEGPGHAIITATTEDGGFAATSEVTVNSFAVKRIDNLFRVDSGPEQGKKATLYDGTIEKYNGYYYAMGTGTLGFVYRSKDMIHWESPYRLISNDPSTMPPTVNPADYNELGASDLFYHNGVMFYSYNGTSLIHGDPSTMNTVPDFRNSFWDKKFDDGIDPQLFVAHNGDLIFLRKVNPDELDPNTGHAKPGRAGAWLWNVESFFNEKGNPDRSKALETVTTQMGHWANMNFVNFEGPELHYHNGQYYMLYVGNQMFPETGLYDTGVAQADSYDKITNDSKYPGKLLARNAEELILKYRVLLPTSEHGGQPYQYTFKSPLAGWNSLGADTDGWVSGEGGFGWPDVNRAKIPSIYNDGKTAGSEIWSHPNGPASMWAKRSFSLDAVPEKTVLRYRLQGYGKLYVNGKELFAFDGQQRAYKMVEVPAELLQTGENVIAVEAGTNGPALNFYHMDFGLYDTNGHAVEPDIIGPSQPNVIVGPNGFETWVTYKAFWNSDNGQGKDRVYFWDQEMVVDGPTSYDSEGLHPDAWTPTFQDRFDSESSLQHYEMPETDVSIDNGTLYFNAAHDSKRVLLNGYEAENFFMETNLRFEDKDFGDEGQAGMVVWHRDENNYVSLLIDRDDRKLVIQSRIDGVSESSAADLPSTFAFLHDDARAADFAEQYHTLRVYKNGTKLFAELDQYTLNDDRPVFEHETMAAPGQIGLISNKAIVRMDNVTVTTGWSEYGTYINGWDEAWSVSGKGLQSPAAGEALTVKGDRMLEHEFSVNVNTGALPEAGKAGIILAYIDARNYVTASTNYATNEFELRKVVDGREELIAAAPAARDTIYGHSNYAAEGQREYVYDLRGEAEVSSAKMLWFHGPFQYVNKNFELPDSTSANFKFDSKKDGWDAVPFTYQDKGRGDYHIADFEDNVKTSQLRLSVPSESNRPFTFVVREEVSSQNFYKAVRSKGKIYVWVNNELIFDAEDPFENRPAQTGLYTDGIQATYNAFTGFDVSGRLAAGDDGGASLTVKAEVAGEAGSNGWYVSDVQVTLRPEGEDLDHVNLFYSLDAGNTWHEYSRPIAISAEGRNELRYYADDGTGNTTETATLTISIDKTAPVIKLNGLSSVTVTFGAAYREQGATATDNIGPVGEITVTGEVNTNKAGTYTLRYHVSDQAGNAAAEAERKVTVKKKENSSGTEGPVDEGSHSEESPPPASGSKEQQTDVSPEESKQLELEGGVKIHIPAGAVSSKGTIRIAVVEPDQIPANGDLESVSQLYELSSTAGERFSKSLELSFVYDAKQLKPGTHPAVYYYHKSQKRWLFIGGYVEEEGTIRVDVDHFTTFAVFSYEPAALKDMANHWAASYVRRLAGMNVAAGYLDGNFRPEETVTRFEFAKMLASALGLEEASRDTKFSDNRHIPSWAKPHVAAAVEAGLILGYEEAGTTSFKGERTVTRAEAAVILVRALQLYGTGTTGLTSKAPGLKDASDIPSWAKPSIDKALSMGILSGYEDGAIRADQETTRGEAAAMIYKLLAALGI